MLFPRRSRATYPAVGGPIRPKFELVRTLMHVIVTCKYEKERMKNSREKVDTVFSFITLSVTVETTGWIWPTFKLIQALMYAIITCTYEKDPFLSAKVIINDTEHSLRLYNANTSICILYVYPTKKKRIQLYFPIFLKITLHSVILFTLFFSVLIG